MKESRVPSPPITKTHLAPHVSLLSPGPYMQVALLTSQQQTELSTRVTSLVYLLCRVECTVCNILSPFRTQSTAE